MIEYYIIACCFLTWLGITWWGIHIIRSKWHVIRFKAVEAEISNISTRQVSAVSDYDFSEFGKVDNIIVVSYKFTVDGHHYRGTGEGGIDNRTNNDLLYDDDKKKGDKIIIYYNPDNPNENYLRRNYVLGGILVVVFGQLFFLLGLDLIDRWVISFL